MSDDTHEEHRAGGILLATDGSEPANAALAAGLRLVDPAIRCVLVSVVPAIDPMMVVGSGHAGPVMTPAEQDVMVSRSNENAHDAIDEARRMLIEGNERIDSIEALVLWGEPGEEICRYAADHDMDAIVMGTTGRGGLKRALLGSVSDHVVRHATCPVITINTT